MSAQISENSVSKQLKYAQRLLSENSIIDNPALESEILLGFCLEKSRTWLKTWPDHPIDNETLSRFYQSLKRRQNGEPMAYIIGSQDFWTLHLKVNQHTLIPRPETELLVETAVEKIPKNDNFKVVDLGTGTGAIALAIAKERPNSSIFAIDFSPDALLVAQENSQLNQVNNVIFEQDSWLDNWSHGKLDVIVSNPPYVADGDPHLQDLTFEPITALVAENQGLADIETITKQASLHLNTDGWLMFEHGYEQQAAVQKILQKAGFKKIETIKDLSGQPRVSLGQWQD